MNTYGTLSLTASSPAQSFTEVLTSSQVKGYLNLPERSPVDAEEDALIDLFIAAAREQAEIAQGRDLVEKQYDLVLDDLLSCEIELRPHLVSVDLFRYTDSDGNLTTLEESTDYLVDVSKQPGIVLPPYNVSWPSFTPYPSSAVLIRFTCGLSDTHPFWADGAGKKVKAGMLMLISEWFNNRLPLSYDLSVGGSVTVDRIHALLSSGAIERVV